MKKRPISVTICAWVLIVMGAIFISVNILLLNNSRYLHYLLHKMSNNPIPIPIQFALSYITLLVIIVSGIAMLKGKNWARFLYVICLAIGFVIDIATSPFRTALIPYLVIYIIIAFFLFLPKASEYFVGK